MAGETAEARLLARALDVAPANDADDDPSRSHVHGFHTYPARMHPDTASRLVQAFVPAGRTVLDPFCGSGTVLIEAAILGRRACGVDLNPLAVRLARCKSRPRAETELRHLVTQVRECAAFADHRRLARVGGERRFDPEDTRLFEPHVLLELESLRLKVESLRKDPAWMDLSLVLSALLVKWSRKPGDTSHRHGVRRSPPGAVARAFVQKAEDFSRRLRAFSLMVPSGAPLPCVEQEDATQLQVLTGMQIDAIVTSPPYAGTYDYLAHHALRCRWLGLDASPLARGEIGARSAYEKRTPGEAREAWSRELVRFFRAAGRVLPRGAPVVLMMADSAVGRCCLRADEIVAATSAECGFDTVARASQTRAHFHSPTRSAFRERPRAEHAILLRYRPAH